jgi:hypothetical protein
LGNQATKPGVQWAHLPGQYCSQGAQQMKEFWKILGKDEHELRLAQAQAL